MQLMRRGAYGMAGTHIGKVVVAMAPTHDTRGSPDQAANQGPLAAQRGNPTLAALPGPVRRPAQANLAAAYEYVEQQQAVDLHGFPHGRPLQRQAQANLTFRCAITALQAYPYPTPTLDSTETCHSLAGIPCCRCTCSCSGPGDRDPAVSSLRERWLTRSTTLQVQPHLQDAGSL